MTSPQTIGYRYNYGFDHQWWSVGFKFPYFGNFKVFDMGEQNVIWKFTAPTRIRFEKSEHWHKFDLSVLGFGFYYAHQWSY